MKNKLPKKRKLQKGGQMSKLGYSDNSPYKNRESIDINTPTGLIDMNKTSIPLIANSRYLPPNSGLHQFNTTKVTEEPIKWEVLPKSQNGSTISDPRLDKSINNQSDATQVNKFITSSTPPVADVTLRFPKSSDPGPYLSGTPKREKLERAIQARDWREKSSGKIDYSPINVEDFIGLGELGKGLLKTGSTELAERVPRTIPQRGAASGTMQNISLRETKPYSGDLHLTPQDYRTPPNWKPMNFENKDWYMKQGGEIKWEII